LIDTAMIFDSGEDPTPSTRDVRTPSLLRLLHDDGDLSASDHVVLVECGCRRRKDEPAIPRRAAPVALLIVRIVLDFGKKFAEEIKRGVLGFGSTVRSGANEHNRGTNLLWPRRP